MKRLFVKLGISDAGSFFAFFAQFIKFGLIGVSNTLVALGVYYSLLFAGLHYITAHAGGFVISVLNAYYWNGKFVFKTNDGKKTVRLAKVYVSYGITFLLSTAMLFLMVDILGISGLIAPVINLFFTVPANFLLNKFWVFG